MIQVTTIARRPAIRAALAGFHDRLDAALEQIIAIQQIPAPTFDEERRACYMEEQFKLAGLAHVARDGLNNVYGLAPGRASDRPPLVISAHLDTVFPARTDLSVRREGSLLYGPGIGDNCTGLGGLLLTAQALVEHQLSHAADIYFVANVGEEGLGDLCGMRAVVERFGGRAVYIVVEGGLYGQLTHQAVGVRRYRIDVSAPGGHSWGGFGAASAIHILGHLIAAIDGLNVPALPKTTYNVGIVEGGLSVNSIANSARMWLDLRSEGAAELLSLVEEVEILISGMNRRHDAEGNGVQITMEQVGNRPAGSIPRQTPVVACADAALRAMGCADVRYIASSTDANIPLSQGFQAICLGLTHSGNAHRPDEYIDVTQLPAGLGQLLLTVLAVSE